MMHLAGSRPCWIHAVRPTADGRLLDSETFTATVEFANGSVGTLLYSADGDPAHPKGKANGYLISLGGKRILFAGVTQCVPELRALKDIDVAFVPMNIPPNRMAPQEAADCVKLLRPKVVYVNHYDQDYAARLTNPQSTPRGLPGGLTVDQTVAAFGNALKNTGIEFRNGPWYPAR